MLGRRGHKSLLVCGLCILALPLPAADVKAILAERVDARKRAVGVVVGTIDAKGREIVGYGRVALDRDERPGADTVFEIGSITKVFTALLLADMAERGEVKLDDPVSKYLPETVKAPSRGGREITLLDLAMHISGLPRVPNNFRPADWGNPYADYTPEKLYEFLSSYALTRDIGESYSYSNVGAGLLGHALARRAGMSYGDLVHKRILGPLKMTSTSVTLSPDQKRRLAAGHSASLQPVKNWDLDALAGAGALRSTADDMLKFLAANMELVPSPLKAAMRRMRSIRRETGVANLDIAIGWHILKQHDELVWHNGGTGGYRAFAGFNPQTGKGAVVLSNSALDNDDLGRHLLDERYPLRAF